MKTPHFQTILFRAKYEETLSQEQQIHLENVKRIMCSEKTTLPSLRNIKWKTLKIETNKINHIHTNNITKLNEVNLCRCELSL